MCIEQLRKDAIDYYNNNAPDDYNDRSRDLGFLNRITVNYVRHSRRLTRIAVYGAKFYYNSDTLKRMYSDKKTHDLLKERVLQKIGIVYHELHEETERQIAAISL